MRVCDRVRYDSHQAVYRVVQDALAKEMQAAKAAKVKSKAKTPECRHLIVHCALCGGFHYEISDLPNMGRPRPADAGAKRLKKVQ